MRDTILSMNFTNKISGRTRVVSGDKFIPNFLKSSKIPNLIFRYFICMWFPFNWNYIPHT